MNTKHRLKIILIFAFTFVYHSNSTACTCWPYVEHFCGIVNNGNYIVRATITENISEERRKVKLLDNLNLEIQEETFTLLGQDGGNCGELLAQFSLGDTLIMALSIWDDDYYLEGACGLHFLRYINGFVYGHLYPDSTSMPYDLFTENLMECMDFTNSTSELEEEVISLNFYPNPVQDILNVNSNQGLIEALELYSIQGERIIYKSEVNSPSANMNLSSFQGGIYLLKASIDGREIIQKIYKK